jgi:hypothetical protein
MSEIHAVALRGPFSADDLAEIADLVFRIDARNPTATFEFYAVDPDDPVFATKRGEARPIKSKVLPRS